MVPILSTERHLLPLLSSFSQNVGPFYAHFSLISKKSCIQSTIALQTFHKIKDTYVTTMDSRVPFGVSFESQCHKLIIIVSDVFEQFRDHMYSENLLLLLALMWPSSVTDLSKVSLFCLKYREFPFLLKNASKS